MPGNVGNAVPATVLPWSLCKAFGHSREYIVNDNEYRNGESQRGRLTDTSRKRWTTGRRVTPTLLATFRTFFNARKGSHEAFYFYDPWDTSPKFSYDPTGVETIGRYTVRLDSPWSQICNPGRSEAEIILIELA
jgi:hypothetical protein